MKPLKNKLTNPSYDMEINKTLDISVDSTKDIIRDYEVYDTRYRLRNLTLAEIIYFNKLTYRRN